MKTQVKRWYKKHKPALVAAALTLLSIIGLSLPFLGYNLGWLGLVGLLPLLYLLQYLQKHGEVKALGFWWMVGFGSQAIILFWMLQTQPERWAGTSGWTAIGGLVFGYLAFALVLSVGFVVAGWLYKLTKSKLDNPWVFLTLPAAWVIGEFVRSWLFSVISSGPNTTLGPFWNFGALGFAASVTPLVYLSRFVGLWGLSFAVVVVNLAVFWLLHKRWKLPAVIGFGLMLATVLSWLIYKDASSKSISVAAVQLGTNDSLQIGGLDFRQGLFKLSQAKQAEVLVLSEYSGIFAEDKSQTDQALAHKLLSSENAPIITSTQTQPGADSTERRNTLTVYNPEGKIVREQDKQFLIPIGEAMPYAFIFLLKAIGQGKVIDDQFQSREVTRSPKPDTTFELNDLKIGALACSGAIGPELYRSLAVGGAQILTNSASLSIFAKAPAYHQQAQQMARFIAVANARPFVQATDGSYSFIIDQNGSWLAKSGQQNLELLVESVKLNNTKTLYTLLGEWAVVASAGVLVVAAVYSRRKLDNHKRNSYTNG
ncbi:apolipoprotein N-acyltransferase [Candidatus Saccharibacteria bacterium]|nr:apolipoprotein N-acyltransferase [Candidatus Saccharibacteria bacterium]